MMALKTSTSANEITGGVGSPFPRALRYFQFNREGFSNHYHKRPGVESTGVVAKAKFRGAVRGRSDVTARDERHCKNPCHNICYLIGVIDELEIEPMFAR